ncbi:hypothetical protein [Acinetobacter sp. ANC 3813]|uniref:hypothetical protein n=1 Tax=Acinetobacter sp. ANC 3813 TaxID=1977873 RepID=UPI000A341C71|nr:hypothetical protein [Acinetobacter sp. ANC 3813]OTG88475.1 hypothetical protein B9T34_15595 [Acinetobacter sp. ANC 3813]
MYFWNLQKLIEDLRLNKVTAVQYKNYYIASSILILFSFFAVIVSPEQPLRINFAVFLINVGLLISWTNAIFKANGAEQGKNFLNRFVALYFPIVLRIAVVYLVVLMMFAAVWSLGAHLIDGQVKNYIDQYLETILDPIFSFIVYWRIYKAMQLVNKPLAP